MSIELLLRATVVAAFLAIAVELSLYPIPSEAAVFAAPRRDRTARKSIILPGLLSYAALPVMFLLPPLWALHPGSFRHLRPLAAAPAFGSPVLAAAGIALVAAGTVLGAVATAALRARLSRGGGLETSGVFAVSRNPIVLSLHLTALGFLLVLPTLPLLLAGPVYLLHMHSRIRIEERHLHRRYGSEFAAYCKGVRRYYGRPRRRR